MRGRTDLTKFRAVVENISVVIGVRGHQKVEQGGLAAAGSTNDGIFFAEVEGAVYVLEDRLFRVIAEREVVDPDALLKLHGFCFRFFPDIGA